MIIDLILFGVLAALCFFYVPVWKAVISITALVLIYFAVEWLLDSEGWNR